MAQTKKTPTKTSKKKIAPIERAVLVTTTRRGVFFGYVTDAQASPLRLLRARSVLKWSAATRGFLGLASVGPQSGSRVGHPAPAIEIPRVDVTLVAECSAEAVARFEAAPWE